MKLSFRKEGETKTLSHKGKLKGFVLGRLILKVNLKENLLPDRIWWKKESWIINRKKEQEREQKYGSRETHTFLAGMENGTPTLENRWKYKVTVAQSCLTLCNPWTIACQALCMGFSRQEYWSGLPFPSPGNLLNPGIKPWSPALQVDSLPSEPPGKPSSFS